MSHFKSDYARCYELLYKDKDYQAEADFVFKKIKEFNAHASSVLEIGCGTGKHASYLNQKFAYSGCDLSSDMITIARQRNPKSEFFTASLEELNVAQHFDAVISLFHVISYVNSNADLERAFANIYRQLNPGGVFLFDVWYGPAVLTAKPAVRAKRVGDDEIRVVRIAEPEWLPQANVVKVHYDVFLEDLADKQIRRFQETHAMRYFFLPEMTSLLSRAGFQLRDHCEWLTGKPLSEETWGASFVAQKPQSAT